MTNSKKLPEKEPLQGKYFAKGDGAILDDVFLAVTGAPFKGSHYEGGIDVEQTMSMALTGERSFNSGATGGMKKDTRGDIIDGECAVIDGPSKLEQ